MDMGDVIEDGEIGGTNEKMEKGRWVVLRRRGRHLLDARLSSSVERNYVWSSDDEGDICWMRDGRHLWRETRTALCEEGRRSFACGKSEVAHSVASK